MPAIYNVYLNFNSLCLRDNLTDHVDCRGLPPPPTPETSSSPTGRPRRFWSSGSKTQTPSKPSRPNRCLGTGRRGTVCLPTTQGTLPWARRFTGGKEQEIYDPPTAPKSSSLLSHPTLYNIPFYSFIQLFTSFLVSYML